MTALRRIRAHLRILENGAPVTANERSRTYERSKRRHSVSYADSPSYIDRPHRGGNIEYSADRRGRIGAHPDQFIRLETYSPSSSNASSKSRVSRSSSVRHESRGRSERRYDNYDSSSDGSDYYSEKKRYRGRSSQR